MRGRKTSQGNIGHTERRKEKGLDPTSPSEQQQLKIGRYENDIERHRKGYAERVVRSSDGSIGHRPLRINPLIHTDMAKRNSKTAAQQCRYYEVDNIFEYMVETYINGNFSTFRKLYHELNKEARKDFIDFLLSEVKPTYWREILQETI